MLAIPGKQEIPAGPKSRVKVLQAGNAQCKRKVGLGAASVWQSLPEPGELVDAPPWSESRGTWEQTVPSCSFLISVDLWGHSQKEKA